MADDAAPEARGMTAGGNWGAALYEALGPEAEWPLALRTVASIVEASTQPMFVVWGPAEVLLYNAPYGVILGARHPQALGRGFFEVWPELADDLRPLISAAYAGQPTAMDDIALLVNRHGEPEEAHFAFSYTPIRDEHGAVAGVFCACRETTEEVFARRRREFWLAFEARLAGLSSPQQIIAASQAALGEHLDASRVGYGEVDYEARFFTTEGNWTDGSVAHQNGTHDLAAFGQEIHDGLRTGRPLVVRDVRTDFADAPDAIAAFEALEMRAALTVSLVKEGRMRAALYVHSREPRYWSAAEAQIAQEVAERTWAAVERARAESQVASVLDSILESFVLLDRQFRVLRVNAEALRMERRPASEIIGRTHWEVWPGSQAMLEPIYRTAMETGAPVSLEKEYVYPDGRAFWLDVRAYPSPEGLAIFYRDLTARRAEEAQHQETQASLRDSEEMMRIAQRAGRIGAFELFPETGRIAVSEEFCRIWGLPIAREFFTRELLDLVHAEDRAMLRTGEITVDNATLDYIEYRMRRPDTGEERWLARRGEVLDDPDGRKRILGVSYDITDRKRAEIALKQLAETLEAQVAERTAERDRMWRLSTDIMLVADFEAKVVAVNPAWTTLLGWRDGELIGRSFLDLIHPDDLQPTLNEVRRLEEGLTTLRFENRYRHRDGDYRWISWTAVPDASHIHAVGRDVTADKARVEELEQAQAALRQAQKMEAVGQLTGGIAHDFNNLLTGVLGSLDLLTRRVQQGRLGEIDRYVNAATRSASRAAALTQRLLAFSRRQPLDPKPVDANRLLLGMDELLRRSLGETVSLEFVCAGGLWATLCDPHQLESAVLNLAINARDAMPDGGKLIIETCNAHLDDAYAARERQVKPGQYVCICVTDTGTGIPPEVLDRVVEPFFTTKPIGQGTGLGLSMIYGFAQQSEGYLKIYSEVEQGTTVKLYLPRYYGQAEEGVEPVRAAVPTSHPGRDDVVLVVEDEDAVRDVVLELLGELGCSTLEAFDGPSGLQVLQSDQRIDLLVTDVGLPGLNGRQLADAARALRPALKVLFMTGYAENATLATGFLEPGMQMVTKPFAIEALSARIRDMLDERR